MSAEDDLVEAANFATRFVGCLVIAGIAATFLAGLLTGALLW